VTGAGRCVCITSAPTSSTPHPQRAAGAVGQGAQVCMWNPHLQRAAGMADADAGIEIVFDRRAARAHAHLQAGLRVGLGWVRTCKTRVMTLCCMLHD
jgi:hypothetical protein